MARLTPALIAALAALMVPPASAGASTASVQGSTLVLEAAAGESNEISFNLDSRGYGPDDTAGIVAGPGCVNIEPTRLACDRFDRATISLGDGDDRYFDADSTRATIDGGAGSDTINAGALEDVIRGGDGRDTLSGSSENDEIDGGPGDDSILGEEGDDVLTGGPGRDTINGDGQTNAAFGNDTIEAADGEQDLVDCNFGSDRANVDASDVLTDCEAVTGKATGGDGGGGPEMTAPPAEPLRVALSTSARRVRRSTLLSRGISGRLAVNRGVTLTLRLKARLGGRELTIGSAAETVTALGEFRYALKVSTRYRARIKKLRRLSIRVTLIAQDVRGAVASATKTVTMRP